MNEIFIAAGGTGGHIFPALSIAQHLSRDFPVRFIGTKRGMERKLVPEAGFSLSFIRARGWNRTSAIDFLSAFGDNIVGLFQSGYLFIKFRPRAVLVFGSYVSLLIAFWAKLFRVPIFVQEQNIHPGFANRIISRWSKKIFVPVDEAAEGFRDSNQIVIIGNPLREEVLDWQGKDKEAKEKLGLDPQKKTLLIIGGSRGSHLINQAFWQALPFIEKLKFQVIHITGDESFQEAMKMAALYPFPYLIYEFYPNPGIFYSAADLAISRSGANVTYELFCFGLPAVLIPFGGATEGHQLYNAQWLGKKQPVVIIDEIRLQPEGLAQAIRSLSELPAKKYKKNEDFRFSAARIAGMIVKEIRRRK